MQKDLVHTQIHTHTLVKGSSESTIGMDTNHCFLSVLISDVTYALISSFFGQTDPALLLHNIMMHIEHPGLGT